MPDYRRVRAFSLAQELNLRVHQLLPHIPARRAPGLRAQIARAISSVPANIAEGAAQDTTALYVRFLRTAVGSAHESAVHLHLAASLVSECSLDLTRCENQARVVAAMITKLIARIQEAEARRQNERWNARVNREQREQGET
jgi:four helix bundle protein